MTKALFISITATGTSPMYSRLTSVTSAIITEGSFSIEEKAVNSLEDELGILLKLSAAMPDFDIILYNDALVPDYLKECCRQYGIRLDIRKHDFLYNHTELLDVDPEEIKSRIPVICGELKHFYANYRDYYYLPAEDTAYHKSVSSFVDRSYRVQAKASTAYMKKTGSFVPVLKGVTVNPDLIFRKSFDDRQEYVPLECLDLSDRQVLCSYIFLPHKPADA